MTKIYKSIPNGWRIIKGNTTRINNINYQWICNNKSRFSGEYEHGLLEVK